MYLLSAAIQEEVINTFRIMVLTVINQIIMMII